MYRDETEALRARCETLEAELELERKRREAAAAETRVVRATLAEEHLARGRGPRLLSALQPVLVLGSMAVLSTMMMAAFIWAAQQRITATALRQQLVSCVDAHRHPPATSGTVADLPAPASTRGSMAASIRLHRTALERACFDAARQRRPAIEAEIDLQLQVDPAGEVISAEIDEASGSDRHLEDCALREAWRWRFPPQHGAAPRTVFLPLKVRPLLP